MAPNRHKNNGHATTNNNNNNYGNGNGMNGKTQKIKKPKTRNRDSGCCSINFIKYVLLIYNVVFLVSIDCCLMTFLLIGVEELESEDAVKILVFKFYEGYLMFWSGKILAAPSTTLLKNQSSTKLEETLCFTVNIWSQLIIFFPTAKFLKISCKTEKVNNETATECLN